MWEENTNINQNVGKKRNPSFSPMKSRLKQMAISKQQAKQSSYDQSMEHLSAWAEQLDIQAYQTNDAEATKAYQKEAQKAKVAAMVKYAATRAWQDWSKYQSVQDILTKYLSDVQSTPWVWNAIKEFVNSDDDAEAFWIAMWWIESDQEDSMNMIEQFFSDIWDTLRYPADVFGQWLSDFIWWADRFFWDDDLANTRALNEFAYHKYWKYIEDMTEDEILRLELDLQLQNISNGSILSETNASVAWDSTSAYQDEVDRQRMDTWALWTVLWWGTAGVELAFPWASAVFSLLWNAPLWREALSWLTERWYDIWNLTTLIPWFDDYIAWMPEDVQEEYKMIWWNTLMSLLLHQWVKYWTTKSNPNWKWRVNRDWINKTVKNINSWEFMNTVEELRRKYKVVNPDLTMDMLRNPTAWGKNYLKSNYDQAKWMLEWSIFKEKEQANWKKTPSLKELMKEEENMKLATDIAWKVAWSTNEEFAIWESDITRRALQELKDSGVDLSKITTDEQLLEALWEHSDQIAVFEDWIYSQDKRRWKKTNTVWVVKNTDAFWISDAYISDQIWKWFDVLKDIYKNSPQILSELRILEQRWEKVWLTRQEVNNMARMISEWAKIYKTTNRDMLTAEWVDKAEKARNWLKEWARLPYKDTVPGLYQALEYLDNAWSDNLNLQAMTVRNLWDAQAYRNWTPWQERWQELWTVWQRTWASNWKNILDAILKNKRYNPSTRAADLKKNLTKFQEIDSKLPRENYQQKVKEWYEETFRDIVSPEWTSYNLWEWEVISPNKNRYSDPRNYLEDIVEVVTETEMWEPDIIRLESQLRKLWLNEEEIAAAKEATKIVQDSLFKEWDVDNSVTVADIKDWVATKTLKSKNSKKK